MTAIRSSSCRPPGFRPAVAALSLNTVIALVGLAGPGRGAHADWPRWRGPADNGSTPSGRYPVNWTPDTALWKTPLPGKGCSTPIVWKERIYLTAPVEGRDYRGRLRSRRWDAAPLENPEVGAPSASITVALMVVLVGVHPRLITDTLDPACGGRIALLRARTTMLA